MKKSILILLSAVFCAVLSAQLPDKPLLKVFDAAYRKTPLENVLFSPWGIQECFGMVYAGAGEKAANELDKTLGINGQLAPELRQAREFFKQDNAKFNSFNAVIFDRKYSHLHCRKSIQRQTLSGRLQTECRGCRHPQQHRQKREFRDVRQSFR